MLEEQALSALVARLADDAAAAPRAGAPPLLRSAAALEQAAAGQALLPSTPAGQEIVAHLRRLAASGRALAAHPGSGPLADAVARERLAADAAIKRYGAEEREGAAALAVALQHPAMMGAFGRAAVLATVLALVALATALSARLSRPLQTLTEAMAAVGAGDLERPLAAGEPTELAGLFAGYRAMTLALRERQCDLDGQLRRTRLLIQLSLELRETVDQDEIVERVLRLVGANLDVDSATLVLAGPGGQAAGGREWRAGAIRPTAVREGGLLAARGLGGGAFDFGGWPGERRPVAGDAVVLPVRQGSATLGALTIFAAGADQLGASDVLLLEGVAAQAGVALSAAQRYQEERQRREQALGLLELSRFLTAERSRDDLASLLAEQSRAIFRAQHGLLFLRPAGSQRPPAHVGQLPAGPSAETLRRAADAAARACASEQIVAPDSADGDGCVALPLVHAGATLGACVLIRFADPAAMPANLWAMLTVFTNSIAAACANLEHVETLRLYAGRLEQLIDRRTEELRRSRDLLRVVFDNLPEGLLLIGLDGTVLAANNALCRAIVGRPPRALVGQGYDAIWAELRRQSDQRLEPQGPREGQAALVPADAEPPGLQGGAWRVLRTDLVGQQRWYAVERIGVQGPGDEVEQWLERWSDITQQEELQRRLLLHEQMTSLGRLAASVAHEVGNPLQSALGCLELCREDAGLSERARDYLGLALGELDRMARTMDSLRNLYRPPQISWEPVDLNRIAREVAQLTGRQIAGARLELRLDLDESLPLVEGQPDALRQVLLNLLLNAQEATPAGGAIAISTRRKPTDRVCELVVRDSGCGMSAEQLAHLFEPFRSGKAQGVGLGLYLSRRLVEQHRGSIGFASQLGAGTTVTVHLPWSDAGPERRPAGG